MEKSCRRDALTPFTPSPISARAATARRLVRRRERVAHPRGALAGSSALAQPPQSQTRGPAGAPPGSTRAPAWEPAHAPERAEPGPAAALWLPTAAASCARGGPQAAPPGSTRAPARSRAGRRLLATELPATCRWGTGPAALASTRARGCACRSAAGAGRSAASRALQAAGACASGPCDRQLMRSAPAAALWRHRGPSRRRRVRSSRARLRRGGPAVVLSGHTHGHTQVSAPSILGLGLGFITGFGDFIIRSENYVFPLLLNAY